MRPGTCDANLLPDTHDTIVRSKADPRSGPKICAEVTSMAETFETRRELQLNVSADQAWEWLSNIGNAMTVNQFHVGLDCDPADFRNPSVGLDVPIVHEIYG